MKKFNRFVVVAVLLLLSFLTACEPNDLTSSVYVPNLLPNGNNTGNVGTSTDVWQNGYFTNINGHGVAAAYGEMWTDATPGGSVTVTVAGTYYTYTPANHGLSQFVTLGPVGETIAVTDNRTYKVSLGASCTTSHPGATIHWAVLVNGVRHNEVSAEEAFASNVIGTVFATGLIALKFGDVVTMAVTSDFAGDVITINHASLTVNSLFGS